MSREVMQPLLVAGNKMAAIINTAITAPVDEWPTTDELDAAIEQWKKATATDKESLWVGLTDEELNELFEQPKAFNRLEKFARAIEAKLKEKNT